MFGLITRALTSILSLSGPFGISKYWRHRQYFLYRTWFWHSVMPIGTNRQSCQQRSTLSLLERGYSSFGSSFFAVCFGMRCLCEHLATNQAATASDRSRGQALRFWTGLGHFYGDIYASGRKTSGGQNDRMDFQLCRIDGVRT